MICFDAVIKMFLLPFAFVKLHPVHYTFHQISKKFSHYSSYVFSVPPVSSLLLGLELHIY